MRKEGKPLRLIPPRTRTRFKGREAARATTIGRRASMARADVLLLAIAAAPQVNNISLPVYLPYLSCAYIGSLHLSAVIPAYNTCIYLTTCLSLSESALFHTRARKNSFSCKEMIELKDEEEEMHTKERKRCSQQEYRDRSHEGKSVKERVIQSVRWSEME